MEGPRCGLYIQQRQASPPRALGFRLWLTKYVVYLLPHLLRLRTRQVVHRAFKILVTQDLLDGLQVHAVLQQGRRVGRTELVRMRLDTGLLREFIAVVPHVRVAVAIAVGKDPLGFPGKLLEDSEQSVAALD